MKKLNKIISIAIAFVMMFGLCIHAFAADQKGSITVDNPVQNTETGEYSTYKAYKIFDVTYTDNKDSYAYSIAGDSKWYTEINTYAADTGKGLTLTKAASEDTYAVTIDKDTFSAADFAAYLSGKTGGKDEISFTFDGEKATAGDLDLGYYFVTTTTGAICNLTTTDPDVTIHDKNDITFEKTDDKSDVEIGEEVGYTITTKVPTTEGYETYLFEIADTMSEGLTFNDDVKIKVDGEELSTDKYEYKTEGNGFTLKIDMMHLQEKVTKPIVITYIATVNEKAVQVISKNKATLTYSNNPTDKESHTTTPPEEEKVFSARIVIDKYEEGNKTKKLSGAEFVLKNDAGEFYHLIEATETEKAYITWEIDQKDATIITTDANGAGQFDGLKNGTYSLLEIKAPTGYNLLKEEKAITIQNTEEALKDEPVEVEIDALRVDEEVGNNKGTELPETGGIGTTMFYVFGGLLAVGAGVLLVTRKRLEGSK